jgi:hypothetical protein
MRENSSIPRLLGAILWLAATATIVVAQNTPDTMAVVLKNDAVFVGQVSQVEGGIGVRSPSGSVTVFSFAQVAFLAESLDAAYLKLAASANLTQASEVRRLFEWSLKFGLTERAAELLRDASNGGLDSGTIEGMVQRLRQFHESGSAAMNAPSNSGRSPSVGDGQPASHEIEAALDSLPEGMEAFFNQKLHPRLIAGCAAANCHGRGHEGLRLWHDGGLGAQPRGYARRNLHQILQWVDRGSPADSKILTLATAPHGKGASAPWKAGEPAEQLLRYWVYAISQHPERYFSEVAAGSEPPAIATASLSAGESDSSRATSGVAADADSSRVPNVPPQIGKPPESTPAVISTEACDPSLFNRKHHPDRAK